ncbi:15170_t:CDS:2, partial [Funneliformis geosporum]
SQYVKTRFQKPTENELSVYTLLYRETGSTEPKQHPGRQKKLKECDTRALKRIIRTDRLSPLGDVTDKFNISLNTTLHSNIVRSYLHDEVVVEGNMDSDKYVNILANRFISWVDNYPNSIFQQDGASCLLQLTVFGG